MQPRTYDYVVLAIGVLAVSTAALFTREADAPSIVIAAYRLVLVSIPLLAVSTGRGRSPLRGSRDRILLTTLAGVFLALHFATWIASVKDTSVATSVFLVTTSPLFVAMVSGPLLGERIEKAMWLGIVIATVGGVVMVGDDITSGTGTLLGDFYALLGAVFGAGYYIIGRRIRSDGEAWLPYVTLTYSTGAVVLAALVLISGHSFGGYSTRTFVFMGLMAAIPQLIGHTVLNRSLGYMSAVVVSTAVLGEPVGSTILAALFLQEWPTPLEVIGGIFVLAGVYVALRTKPAEPLAISASVDIA